MSEWKKVKLGECCEITSSKRCHASERSKEGIPFYCSKEIIQLENGEEVRESDYIPVELYESIKHKYGAPKQGDLLLTTRGTNGIPYVYKDKDCFYFADGNLSWFKNFKTELSVRFLYYWFKSHIGKHSVDSIAKGTAQKAVPIEGLRNLEIELPTYSTQCRIATILSRYDSLIENYQKQIRLLEESAQRLYMEWFVDLRFPGHENTKIVDGIPEGWEKKKVGDLTSKVRRTKQVSANNYLNSGCIPVIDQSRNYIAGYTNDIESLVEVTIPYIVFGDHTRVLKYVPFSFAKGADGTQLIMSNDLERMPQSLFYNSLIEIDLSNYSYARHFKYLKEESILVPSKDIAQRYDKVVSQYFKSIQKSRGQIHHLTEARDRLLPKLMSGEIYFN